MQLDCNGGRWLEGVNITEQDTAHAVRLIYKNLKHYCIETHYMLFEYLKAVYGIWPYKVDGPKAAMANLSEVREKLLWVFFKEQFGHVRIL